MPVNSRPDGNQEPTLVVYSGTAGTADTRGTSTTVGVSGDPTTGAMYVYNLGPAGSVSLGNITDGTVAVRPQVGGDPGTALTVRLTDGTSFYNASGAGGGTSVQIVHGTIESSGTTTGVGVVTTVTNLTHGTIENSGTVTGVGVVSAITSGSMAVTAGTMVVTGGTINAATATTNQASGTLNVGTINSGTINNGTLSLVTTVTNLTHGTIENSGTVTGVGVVSALNSGTVSVNTPGTITSGSISIIAGTIGAGTINTLGTLTNLANGSINVVAGTINTGTINSATVNAGTVYKGVSSAQSGSLTAAGTLTVAGSQSDTIYWDLGGTWVGTAFFEGQVGTSAYFAVPVTTPLGVQGTQTTGNGDFIMSAAGLDNARLRFTYSSGTLTHNERASNFFSPLSYIMGGSVTNVGTLGTASGVGVVTTVSNITNGTIQNSGTVTGVGVVSAITSGTVSVNTAGTINSGSIAITAGTIGAGTINTLGTVSNILAGTIQNSGTVTGVGVVSAITTGSIVVTAGTMTQTTGTVNSGTINAGTFTSQPYPASQVQSAFAIGTAAIGTLVSAVGAGTGIYVNSLQLIAMSGTLDMCLSFGLGSTTNQVVSRGLFPAGAGIALSFPNSSFYGTSNSALTYQILGGAGTASWQVTYNSKGTP